MPTNIVNIIGISGSGGQFVAKKVLQLDREVQVVGAGL